jgi:alpha-mannosidase
MTLTRYVTPRPLHILHTNSAKLYAELFKTGKTVLKDIYKVLGFAEATGTSAPTAALNTLPWHRKELVELTPDSCAVACGEGPLMTLRTFKSSSDSPEVTVKEISKGVFVLENSQLTIKVERGCITSLYDKLAAREVIPAGQKANQFVIFDDKPLYWQAWDVEVYHLDSGRELPCGETQISESKPHRVSVVTSTKISDKSSIKTTISLSAAVKGEQSYVEVTSDVDWHETMKFLKVEFPVDVRNTEASYETAFGVVRRPTHYNTSWDMAKFEVCCHKFADLSENGYGVSVLNDGKYGFATVGNLMRLSLLRSPKAPDAHADMGTHTIRWAILPHAGGLGSTTVRKGYEFNNPLRLVSGDLGVMAKPPVKLSGDKALVLDTVKRGEDDEDVSRGELPVKEGRSVILRIFDSLGGKAKGTVETAWDVARVAKVNLLEDELEDVEFKDGKFEVVLRPFEVATYKLVLGKGGAE